jgi:hypothetical protein
MNVSTGVAEHRCVHSHWANTCDVVEGAHHTVTAVRAIINTLVVPEPFNAAGWPRKVQPQMFLRTHHFFAT